jgi:hypothetical protein
MARTRKPFVAKHGKPGSTVPFTINGTVFEGEVWSLAPKGVWAFHADGLSGTTLVNVTVKADGSPGNLIEQTTYGAFRRCDAVVLADLCDFGNCHRAATHHFHNGPETRPTCERHGADLVDMNRGRLCEGLPLAAAA